jgi:hypothetical protein
MIVLQGTVRNNRRGKANVTSIDPGPQALSIVGSDFLPLLPSRPNQERSVDLLSLGRPWLPRARSQAPGKNPRVVTKATAEQKPSRKKSKKREKQR